MRKVLITGIAGFVGSHLAERLRDKGAEVWGTLLDDKLGNIEGMEGLNLIQCDLLDRQAVMDAIGRIKPESIFHLAAQSAPSLSFKNPGETLKVNIFSTLNIFEAVMESSPESVVLNVGSGDEYGEVEDKDLPVNETAELRPLNPYAVSKVTQYLLAFQYWKSKGLKTVRCRPFNHYGPRQSEIFVSSEFAKQIAEIEAGIRPEKVIKVGNLEASKDFLEVRDVVSAYEILVEKGEMGSVYNICSGKAIKIREIIDTLISLSNEKIEIFQDPGKKRPSDVKALYGDAGRLKALGWRAEHDLADGLESLLDFWREKVKRSIIV
ncbi:MAG: GDP-mannose 4,6-dehydratase [Deltaproteobacteria bacterium]|nr:GDP-mannose 4,6-dehydratase [Deltaproteobacteria bacterium]